MVGKRVDDRSGPSASAEDDYVKASGSRWRVLRARTAGLWAGRGVEGDRVVECRRTGSLASPSRFRPRQSPERRIRAFRRSRLPPLRGAGLRGDLAGYVSRRHRSRSARRDVFGLERARINGPVGGVPRLRFGAPQSPCRRGSDHRGLLVCGGPHLRRPRCAQDSHISTSV